MRGLTVKGISRHIGNGHICEVKCQMKTMIALRSAWTLPSWLFLAKMLDHPMRFWTTFETCNSNFTPECLHFPFVTVWFQTDVSMQEMGAWLSRHTHLATMMASWCIHCCGDDNLAIFFENPVPGLRLGELQSWDKLLTSVDDICVLVVLWSMTCVLPHNAFSWCNVICFHQSFQTGGNLCSKRSAKVQPNKRTLAAHSGPAAYWLASSQLFLALACS